MPLLELPQAARQLLGVELTADQQAAFDQVTQALVLWNEHRANLTAITEPLAVEMRHYLDSLSILKVATLTPGLKVIDVGTGAGFPGLPLRIVAPGIKLTLLEATGKKTQFLEHICTHLHYTNVKVVHARAEDAGQNPSHREHYDLVLARSVAHMPILMEYLLPLCKIGGQCIAMKGESAAEETHAAEHALQLLGGRLNRIVPIELPHVAETHHLVIIDKTAATPGRYPRKPGLPSKNPL
jgi:16S rRNA (guanine527-N7)-methyltransferase